MIKRTKTAVSKTTECTYGIYILNGKLMFRLDRDTGETHFYAKGVWHKVEESKITASEFLKKVLEAERVGKT